MGSAGDILSVRNKTEDLLLLFVYSEFQLKRVEH